MHRNIPSHPLSDNNEIVTGYVRECVAEMRACGHTTVRALHKISKAWQIAGRRVTTFFYRNQTVLVSDAERRVLANAAADLHDKIGDWHLEIEQRCRAKARAIREREAAYESSLRASEWRHGSSKELRKYAA